MRFSTSLIVALSSLLLSLVLGFVPHSKAGSKLARQKTEHRFFAATSSRVDEMSEESKANLFQFLLRDLQIEGVPLMEVNSEQVDTLPSSETHQWKALAVVQAALWTTMAEISLQNEEQKACLIFESIPIPDLRTFVDDFTILKTQERLMEFLPELERFSLSLVGKGVGPAILVEASERKAASTAEMTQVDTDESRPCAAMKMFVDRMVAGRQISGYPPSDSDGPIISKFVEQGMEVAPMIYRMCSFSEVCHILSSFWNCVCEILASPPGQLRATMLLLPAVSEDDSARFSALSELLSRSLCLYHGDALLELLHMHPAYDRDSIHPVDMPANGHLPPVGWLRPMLRQNGNMEEAGNLKDEELDLLNYQRRSPVTSVCIVPVDLLEAALGPEDGILSIELDGGNEAQASGIATYARSIIDLSSKGANQLQSSLDVEMDIVR
jgi:hypothetical protein